MARKPNKREFKPDYRCPSCKKTNIKIAAIVWVKLIQYPDGSFETDADLVDDRSHEWNDDSAAACIDCGHKGTVLNFSVL